MKGPERLTSGYLEVADGVDIYYEDIGEGQVIILVPGWTFTTKVFEHQFDYFSKNHRVISFDPRGHGRSTVTTSGNDYITQAADMAKLMAHLSVVRPILVGWSFGCLTTWQFIKDNGTDSVRGHVCIDLSPTPMTGVEDDWREGNISEIADMYQAIQTVKERRSFLVQFTEDVLIVQKVDSKIISWIVDQSLKSPAWVASNYLAAGMFSNYLEEAGKVDEAMPSLYVVADHWADTARKYLAKHAPNSRIESFGGHMMFWEYHKEFNKIFEDFIFKIENIN